MTILPKKKGEVEKSEKHTQHAASDRHSHSHAHNHERARRPASPQRWMPPNNQSHDTVVNHNKRRHRSSPHRTVRKHRQTCAPGPSHTHTRSSLASAAPARPATCSPQNPQQSENTEGAEEAEEELETGYNSGDEYVPPKHPENLQELEAWFEMAIKEKRGFQIKKMGEDGACLFRAVADQLYGDQEMHSLVRQNCIDYMTKNADFFKNYVTEDFNEYLKRKRLDTAHGNHIEIQAISELYNRPVEVYKYSLEPTNIFQAAYRTDYDPIRISYHGNVHYNSLVDPCKATIGVGLGLPGYQPGLAEKNLLSEATKTSENFHIEKQMLEDKLRETDWEVTQESIEEQVARESYLQWLKDNEKRAQKQAPSRSASATCSSAADGASANWWEVTMSPEPRTSRSPRQRSNNNSAQNSPYRNDSENANDNQITVPVDNVAATIQPSTSAGGACLGAVGGANFGETTSIMNELPPEVYGLCNEWEEDDIIAQVMAQSQQEYLESLKKKATVSSPAKRSSSVKTATRSSPYEQEDMNRGTDDDRCQNPTIESTSYKLPDSGGSSSFNCDMDAS